jgi:adenylate kinase
MIGITGTPGTGKSAAAAELRSRGFPALDLKMTTAPFVAGRDEARNVDEVNVDAWVTGFSCIDGYVEGALAHFLPCGKIVVLRCRPDILRTRLIPRGYAPEKIRENCDAEALDVILTETTEVFAPEQIYEIETTNRDIVSVADLIVSFVTDEIPAGFGTLDWSAYLDPLL